MTLRIMPCNINNFNINEAFQHLPHLNLKQSTNVEIGELVYIYFSKLISAIKYKIIVAKVDLYEMEYDDSKFVIDGSNFEQYGRYMELQLLELLMINCIP